MADHDDDILDDSGALGWEAITDALDLVHPGVVPAHWGTEVRHVDGGRDPLDGVSAYLVPAAPGGEVAHWHYVGYGLSDLYEKTSADPVWSGLGVELSFRLAVGRLDPADAPLWPANLLQAAARYVLASGRAPSAGHAVDLHAPLTADVPTLLTALLFVADPQLGEIRSPFGRVRVLQLVGLTADELDATRRWNTEGLAVLLQSRDPLFVTDIARPSILDEASVASAVDAGVARDGSSTDVLVLSEAGAEISLEGLRVIVARDGVAGFTAVLPARLGHGRTLSLASKVGDLPVLFHPAEAEGEARWTASSEIVEVWLTGADVDALVATLRATPGEYVVATIPETVFEVV